jgi:hypothetical protein
VNDPIRYGQMKSEKMAEENQICRQIVKEISNFGVTQRQSLMIIYLLASELENVEQMQAITKMIRGLGGDELFLIGVPENVGGHDGSSEV